MHPFSALTRLQGLAQNGHSAKQCVSTCVMSKSRKPNKSLFHSFSGRTSLMRVTPTLYPHPSLYQCFKPRWVRLEQWIFNQNLTPALPSGPGDWTDPWIRRLTLCQRSCGGTRLRRRQEGGGGDSVPFLKVAAPPGIFCSYLSVKGNGREKSSRSHNLWWRGSTLQKRDVTFHDRFYSIFDLNTILLEKSSVYRVLSLLVMLLLLSTLVNLTLLPQSCKVKPVATPLFKNAHTSPTFRMRPYWNELRVHKAWLSLTRWYFPQYTHSSL